MLDNLKQLSENEEEPDNDSLHSDVDETTSKISSEFEDSENETLNKKDASGESSFRRKNFIGEDVISDSLVVFDDITMAIERSKDFVNFLTICRKLGYTCIIYITFI